MSRVAEVRVHCAADGCGATTVAFAETVTGAVFELRRLGWRITPERDWCSEHAQESTDGVTSR